MRWNSEFRGPYFGDTRVREGFLFFPVTLNDETRWLEWARWEEFLDRFGEDWTPWWHKSKWLPDAKPEPIDELPVS
jgi:hypothetical protein